MNIPSKTFLMGEYSVLNNGRALVLGHEPFFIVQNKTPNKILHPESPAGKFLKKNNKKQNFSFSDPHDKSGGFGSSTAEYLAAYKSVFPDAGIDEILKAYFKNFQKIKTKPSGADLCVQSYYKKGILEYKKKPLTHNLYNWAFKDLDVLIFKTKDKVKTHTHLDIIYLKNLKNLKSIAETAIDFFKAGESLNFLKAVNLFTKEQELKGLLHKNTTRLIYIVNQIQGVDTSRGCGAMGADVLTVFVKPNLKEYVCRQVLSKDLGLKVIFKGFIKNENG